MSGRHAPSELLGTVVPGHLRTAPLLAEIVEAQRSAPADQQEQWASPAFRTLETNGLRLVTRAGHVVVPTRALQERIVDLHHTLHQHQGVGPMLATLQQRVWWPTMRADCERRVAECPECQYGGVRSSFPKVGVLRPTLSPHPWHSVYVDAMGKLPASVVGRETMQYVMGAIDAFSRMVFLRPYSRIPADTTIDFLEQLLARSVTRPRILRSDGGTQFDCEKVRDWCKAHGIELVIGVPGHHRGQGLIERVFGTLERALKIICLPDVSSWARGRRLEKLEALINATPHGTLGMSPFAVMHGYEPRLEMDVRLDSPEPIYDCLDEYHTRLAAAQEVALLHSAVAQVDNKAAHDKQHRPATVFEKGEFVLVLDETATKLEPPASGPYRVVERLAGDTYRLARLLTESETRVVHAVRMVRFSMARTSEEREAMRRFGGDVDVIKEITGHTLRDDGGYDFTITWSDGDTTQQCGHSIQKTTVFKEYIASKGIKKGPAIKKPS